MRRAAAILLDDCHEFDIGVRHLLCAKHGRRRYAEPIRESAPVGTELIEGLNFGSGVLPQQCITTQTEAEQPRARTGLTRGADGRALRRGSPGRASHEVDCVTVGDRAMSPKMAG